MYGTASEGGSLGTLLTGDTPADPQRPVDPNAPVTPPAPTFSGSVFRYASSKHTDVLWTHTSGAASAVGRQPNGSAAVGR